MAGSLDPDRLPCAATGDGWRSALHEGVTRNAASYPVAVESVKIAVVAVWSFAVNVAV